MKKTLSIILSAMMLVSVFAVNSSAFISTTYTEIEGATPDTVFLNQDFTDAEKLDFSAGTYGKTTVEDGCVTLHTPSSAVMHVSSPTGVPTDVTKWTLEFSVKRNSDFADTSYYGIIFSCNKSAYKGDEEKIANYIENYGIYIPLMHNDKDVWYTYRVSFDEDAVVEQVDWATATYPTNIPNTLSKYLITKAEYKKAGDANWTSIPTNKGWNSVQGQSRALVRTQASGYAFLGYPVEVDGEMVNTTNEMSFVFRSPHSSYKATEEEELAANFSLDNIRTYVPGDPGVEVEKNYPLVTGAVNLAAEKVTVPDASEYDGTHIYKNINFTTPVATPAAGETINHTITFDAKNTVQGMPIMLHLGGAKYCANITICPTDTIGTDWYSYKVDYYEDSERTAVTRVLRKPRGSEGDYEWVHISGKYDYEYGDELWSYGTPSSGKNCIRIFYYSAVVDGDAEKNLPGASIPDADKLATVWEFENMQVVTDVVAGTATVENETISVDADIAVAAHEAFASLAVYGTDNRLKDIDFARLNAGAGALDLSANYVDGDDAKLIIWDGAANPIYALRNVNRPVITPVDVDATLAK